MRRKTIGKKHLRAAMLFKMPCEDACYAYVPAAGFKVENEDTLGLADHASKFHCGDAVDRVITTALVNFKIERFAFFAVKNGISKRRHIRNNFIVGV